MFVFIGDGAFDTRMKGLDLALSRQMEAAQELVAIFDSERNGLCSSLWESRACRPTTISSMLGCVAAVMAMVSPSQPSPAVIHKTSIS